MKLKVFLCIFFLISSSHAATLQCQFVGNYQCINYVMSPVTQVDEAFTVIGAPFTPFKDNLTTAFSLRLIDNIQEFPRNLFGIFVNLEGFSAQNISTSALIADSFYNCNNLKMIGIQSSSLGYIRNRFASTCHSLTSISIYESPIQGIEEFAFEGLYNLERLDIERCDLTCIPPVLFQPLVSIQSILLLNNVITAVHSQTFAGLRKLQTINLNNNPIQYIPNFNLNSTGIDFTTLTLSCFACPYRAIDPNFMATLYYGRIIGRSDEVLIDLGQVNPQIASSCINFNQISFNGDIFSIGISRNDWVAQDQAYRDYTTCYTDMFVDLMKDESQMVTCGIFYTTSTTESTTVATSSTTPNSTSLSSSGNFGQCATDKVCRYYLDWNNQYTCVIDGAEGTVTSISGSHYLTYTDLDLTRLYFVNSFLSLIPKIIFQKFPNLKYLHVADCGLNIIDDKTFNECGNLEILDASNNQISRFVETSLKNCTKLKIIDLTGNPIDHISNDLYQFDPALERIHLRRLDDWVLA